MRFLLDTNVCVDYLNGRFPAVIERLQALSPDHVAVSAIAVAELRYGADRSSHREENHQRLDHLLEDLAVMELDLGPASAYGALRTRMESQGSAIGPNNMLIAAQALAGNLVLVTDNVDEFELVEGLSIENWRVSSS